MLPDLRREAEQADDLGHPGAGDTFPARNGGLVGDLAGLEKFLPLNGFSEERDHRRSSIFAGAFGGAPASRSCGHNPFRGHPARQGGHVAVVKGPPGPQSDLDRLVVELGPTKAVVVAWSDL